MLQTEIIEAVYLLRLLMEKYRENKEDLHIFLLFSEMVIIEFLKI